MAYDGVQIVSMAQPFICMQFLQVNTKLFKVTINDRKVVITVVTIFFLGKLSSDVFTAFIPSEFGIFVDKDFTSSDTRYELSGTVSTVFSLLMKSLVSLTHDGICLTIG